jgi:alkanesulfonate monooxygenase SsuD/methylene tetrahydromethanopterin reductase-like flavin-dependent oxidoreductase (luciferase family)
MDFGILCAASVTTRNSVAFAETKGFTHAWVGDSQMVWGDVFQCLALCAAETEKIKLGTNVANPSSRIAPVTACNFATLNALAPGRVIMGIGTGNTSRRTLGMPAAKLSELRDHVRVCRGLLNGETVPYQEGTRRRDIRFLDPDAGFVNLNDRIPIYIAASGPKTL